jgi:hypothetical protein
MQLQKRLVEKVAFEDFRSLFFFLETRERTSFEILLLFHVLVSFSLRYLVLELADERIIGVDSGGVGTDDDWRIQIVKDISELALLVNKLFGDT